MLAMLILAPCAGCEDAIQLGIAEGLRQSFTAITNSFVAGAANTLLQDLVDRANDDEEMTETVNGG